MPQELKISNLMELVHYVDSINKYEELNDFVVAQSKRKGENINRLEMKLWKYIDTHINTKKEKTHLTETSVVQAVFSSSRAKRRREVVENLIATIKQFLIHEYLQEDDLLNEWLYWKSLKNTSITESQEQLNIVKQQLNVESLDKASSLHQYIAFDFYKKNYQLDCLNSSTPTNDNLRNAQYALQLINTQNQSEIDLEFQNRYIILEETIPDVLTFENSINYATLIKSIPQIPDDITGYAFIQKYESVLSDESISNKKMETLIGFLINKSYRLFVDKGNQAPLMLFWKKYLDFGFQKRMFYDSNYLNLQYYINALSLVAGMNKEELFEYIQQYKNDLSPIDFPIGNQLGDAFFHYYNNDFEEVIDVLNINVDYGKRVDLKLRYHTFRVRATYEVFSSNNWKHKEEFNRVCKSFKNYLDSKKELLNQVWERNAKFIYWIRQIAKQNSVLILNEYKNQIIQKDVIHSDWLLQKVQKKIGQM